MVTLISAFLETLCADRNWAINHLTVWPQILALGFSVSKMDWIYAHSKMFSTKRKGYDELQILKFNGVEAVCGVSRILVLGLLLWFVASVTVLQIRVQITETWHVTCEELQFQQFSFADRVWVVALTLPIIKMC